MEKYYPQELYQLEKAEFIRKAQKEIWQLWFNRFMNQGILVNAAIANCEDIVRDWSGHQFNKFPGITYTNII
ncbi:MAG: hypothetical protein AAF378_20640 [Cyanobacteria bacterium P01_A01_bin.84]